MADAELLRYAAEFRFAVIGDGISSRMCAAISDPLCAAINVIGVSGQVMECALDSCNHVFIQLADGRVLDPTADQFSPLPAVYLGDATEVHLTALPRQAAEHWAPLLQDFKRIAPQYSAREVGGMVRRVLASLPPGLCDLPGCTSGYPPQSCSNRMP